MPADGREQPTGGIQQRERDDEDEDDDRGGRGRADGGTVQERRCCHGDREA